MPKPGKVWGDYVDSLRITWKVIPVHLLGRFAGGEKLTFSKGFSEFFPTSFPQPFKFFTSVFHYFYYFSTVLITKTSILHKYYSY